MNKIQFETFDSFNQIGSEPLSYPISVVFLNIRSLRTNFNSFLASINNIINRIKIIVLVETNINDNESPFYGINGFTATFLNRSNRSGGGVAVYIKENILHTTISVKTNSFETLHINIQTTENISLLAIYRPPSLSVSKFITELDDLLRKIKKQQNVILVGDININLLNKNLLTTLYIDMMSSNGLQCMINDCTREDLSKNTNTCIDHLFVRCKHIQTHAYTSIIKINISDHYGLLCCLSGYESVVKTIENDTQQTKICNYKVKQLIRTTNWHEIENHSNPNEMFEEINEKFNYIYENSKINIRKKNNRIPNPWMNEDLIRNCEIRDKLFKKWRLNRNNKKHENEYKKYRNVLNKKLNYAKNYYYKNKFFENRNNIRVTWQILNEIIGKKSNNIDENILKNFKNLNLSEICDNFAENFNKNVENILHNCEIKTIKQSPVRLQNSFYLRNTSNDEIFNILSTLNIKKSAGSDGIRPIDLKNNAEILTPILTKLINSIINTAIIPETLKISYVRPIYKSGNKSDFNNYRPISILSVVEKVMEEIICRRLTEYTNKYKVINNNQYGFQKGKNINKLLGNFANYVNEQLSKNHHCLTLFIDFSKAFDTLSHLKLLLMLEKIGIRGHCLEWFKNYLTLRKFYVKISSNLSNETDSEYGVPQGSKLGPLLYIIYSNELITKLTMSRSFAYADDTAIVVAHRNLEDATNIMQHQLDTAVRWCHDHGLIINASKTKLMHIKPPHFRYVNIKLIFHSTECLHKNKLSAFNYNIDQCSTTIEIVNTFKYLGVHVDQNFKWKTHIEEVRKKLRKAAYMLHHLSYCSNNMVMRQAYFSLAESHIRHGITAWGYSTYCEKLQKSQNQLLKTLKSYNINIDHSITSTNDNRLQNTPLNSNIARDLRILSVNSIYKTTLAIEFFNDTRFLQKIDHNYQTRRNVEGRYRVQKYRNDYGKSTLSVKLPTILNDIPPEVLEKCNNKNIRNKILKNYFISQQ